MIYKFYVEKRGSPREKKINNGLEKLWLGLSILIFTCTEFHEDRGKKMGNNMSLKFYAEVVGLKFRSNFQLGTTPFPVHIALFAD